MDFGKRLISHKHRLVDQWVLAVMETYPKESAAFFQNNPDPFANPVGNTIKRSLDLLFDQVIRKHMDTEAAKAALDPIIRIRAVQEFTPAQALSFIFSIKQIIAEKIDSRKKETEMHAMIEANVDALMLMALDIYSACKQQIYTLRINETKARVRQLLIKKDLMAEIPDTDLKCL